MALMVASGCEKFRGTPSTTHQTAERSSVPSRPTTPPEKILAKVNDTVISTRDLELTLADLKARVEAQGGTWQPLPAESQPDKNDLNDLLDLVVMDELRAQDSLARGFDRRTDVQSRFWSLYRSFFSQEWVAAQLDQVRAEVKEEEVEQYYTANTWAFREPERLRVRELVVSSEDQAKAALVKLLEGMDFLTIAQQMSIRPESASGEMVDRQWVMRGAEKSAFAPDDDTVRALDPVLEQAAFAIDTPGKASSYVKGADGNVHIFQLVERTEGRQRPLTEIADRIRDFLRLQKLSEKNEELKRKAKVETFGERLMNVEQP